MIFRMVYKSGPIFYRFVTMHACDRQTDKQIWTEFSSLDRVCIPCSAVKIKQTPLYTSYRPSRS